MKEIIAGIFSTIVCVSAVFFSVHSALDKEIITEADTISAIVVSLIGFPSAFMVGYVVYRIVKGIE